MVQVPMIIRGLIERRAAGHHNKSRPVDDRYGQNAPSNPYDKAALIRNRTSPAHWFDSEYQLNRQVREPRHPGL